MLVRKSVVALLFTAIAATGLVAGIALRELDWSQPDLSGLRDVQSHWTSLNGEVMAVDDWFGNTVLLNFWGSWCAPCVEEMPLLDEFQNRYANQNVKVIGIAIDQKESAMRFLEENSIGFTSLVADPDATDKIMDLFGNVDGVLPFTIVFSEDGSTKLTRAGPLTREDLNSLVPNS